jgi:hypothetical protein
MLRAVFSWKRGPTTSLLGVLALAACLPLPVGAQEKAKGALDLRHIPPDAVGALVLHPRRILALPDLELLPVEILSARVVAETGIDPTDVEQLVALVGPPLAGRLPEWGIIVRLAKAHDQDKILPRLQGRGKPGLHMPDDRTLLIGTDGLLGKMRAARNADSPLVRLLRTADASHQVLAFYSMDAVRDELKRQIAALPASSPEVAELLKFPDHLSVIELHLDLRGTLQCDLTLRAPNVRSAEDLERLTKRTLELARRAVVGEYGKLQRQDDPMRQAVGRYSVRSFEYLFGLIQPVRAGERVTISGKGGVTSVAIFLGFLFPAVAKLQEAPGKN